MGTAREHVLFALSRVFRGDVPHPADRTFAVARVDCDPRTVVDPWGRLLCFLFRAELPGRPMPLWVRAAADKTVGPAILSVTTHRRAENPGPALRCEFFQSLHLHADERVRIWERDHACVRSTLDALGVDGLAGRHHGRSDPDAPRVRSGFVQRSPALAGRRYVPLYAQETEYFCTVASAQMILDFHGFAYSQPEIAWVLEAAEDRPLPEPPAEKAMYEALSGGRLAATIHHRFSWEDAKREIDAQRPFRHALDDHVRVCAGWREETDSRTGELRRRWLRIYDPQSANPDRFAGGQFAWEEWDAFKHENVITVRPCATARS